MSSTGIRVARRIVADALRLNWSGLEVRFAVRCTAGVAIPLIVSAFAGQPLAGASAAYGALVTGLASRQGVYRTRVGAMLDGKRRARGSGSLVLDWTIRSQHRAARGVDAGVRLSHRRAGRDRCLGQRVRGVRLVLNARTMLAGPRFTR